MALPSYEAGAGARTGSPAPEPPPVQPPAPHLPSCLLLQLALWGCRLPWSVRHAQLSVMLERRGREHAPSRYTRYNTRRGANRMSRMAASERLFLSPMDPGRGWVHGPRPPPPPALAPDIPAYGQLQGNFNHWNSPSDQHMAGSQQPPIACNCCHRCPSLLWMSGRVEAHILCIVHEFGDQMTKTKSRCMKNLKEPI